MKRGRQVYKLSENNTLFCRKFLIKFKSENNLYLIKLKLSILSLLVFLFVCKPSSAQELEEEENTGPDTVKIGVYLFSLYDLNFPENKFNADFYVWYNFKNDSLHPAETFELVNSMEFTKVGESREKYDSIIYSTFRCNSVVKKQWNVSDFPFDKQQVELEIEDINDDISRLVFVPDTISSKIDKYVKLEGWKIKNFGVKVVDHTYETNYGDPALSEDEYSTYSRVVVYFTLQREGSGLFFKLFIGLFISVMISLLTFFINPTDLDPRFGLSVGAIFAAIASQYVISSTLPQNQRLTLVDILHDISFIYIFICILISTISLRFFNRGNEKASKKLDWYSFLALSASYVIIVLFFVLLSL